MQWAMVTVMDMVAQAVRGEVTRVMEVIDRENREAITGVLTRMMEEDMVVEVRAEIREAQIMEDLMIDIF